MAASRSGGTPSWISSLTTLIARSADSSQLLAKAPPLIGCLSAWPSTRSSQFTSGGISFSMSLSVLASLSICSWPAGVRSALPTGNSTSLWNTKRSPTTWMPGRFASTSRSLPKKSLR